jgi:hypothetical protein
MQMADLTPGRTYRIKFNPTAKIIDALVTIPKDTGALFEVSGGG